MEVQPGDGVYAAVVVAIAAIADAFGWTGPQIDRLTPPMCRLLVDQELEDEDRLMLMEAGISPSLISEMLAWEGPPTEALVANLLIAPPDVVGRDGRCPN